MLCVCVVLVLLSGALVLGVQLAVKSYNSSIAGSEAQELCSTLAELVSDELRYAREVKTTEGELSFFSANHGYGTGDGVAFHTVADPKDPNDGALYLGGVPLVGAAAYSSYRLRAELTQLSYDETTGWFSACLKVTDRTGSVLAEKTFSVRQLNRARK